MIEISGLATGIGSLPYRNTEEALDLIFKYIPDIPFWPQLPRRSIFEGMIAQFSENIPCIKVNSSGVFYDAADKERELELFYSKAIERDLGYFRISQEYAPGFYAFLERVDSLRSAAFIKTHITGPFTFAGGINDSSGISILHDDIMFQAIVQGLKMKALWQISLLSSLKKKIILFIDEPYLSCFGSAYTSINRGDVLSALNELTEGLSSDDVIVGLHCCGNTDWSMIAECSGIDIISFDAFGFQDKFALYAKEIKRFLDRGGVISWGVIPTNVSIVKPDIGLLVDKIKSGIGRLAEKGLDHSLLKQRTIITPACGLGTFPEVDAERVFHLLSGVSAVIKNDFKE